jgi:MFS family permease
MTTPWSAAALGRAARATAVVFFLSGAVFGTWVSRLPAVSDRLDASTAELGLALLMPGVGSLLSMPLVGRACGRWGSRRVVTAAALPGIAVLPLLAAVGSVPALAAVLGCFGLSYGAWDVAMNVHGSAVERAAGRAWMPRYHACWSVGGIAGSGLGALAARSGLDVQTHFLLAAGAAALVLLLAVPAFVDDRRLASTDDRGRASTDAAADASVDAATDASAGPAGPAGTPPRGRLFTPRLVAIGAVTAGATCLEGAAADWLALYLRDARAVPDGGAAAGYTAFAVAMAAGRFAGTPVIERLGRATAVRLASGLTALGLLATVLLPSVAGAYLGAVVWGLGVALVFPAAMSAGGEVPGRSADGIATVSTIGYAGFLVGPPAVGFLAGVAGLGGGLLALLVLTAAMGLLAPALRPVPTADREDA